jgi:branched-chain amino acid transport system substrate-binding protein
LRQKKNLVYVIVVMLMVTAVAMGCAQPTAPAAPTAPTAPVAPVKIGALFDMTGMGATWGATMKEATEFALKEAGEQVAGRKIQLIIEDTGTDPTIAVDKARKLLEHDKVDILIGPVWTNEEEALYSFVQPYGTPLIHATSVCAPRLDDPQKYNMVFAIGATEWSRGYSTADYVYDKLGYRTASAILHDYSGGWVPFEAFAQRFEEKGGKIVQIQPVPFGVTDLSPFILNLQQADMLFLGMTGAPQFLHQYKQLGGKLPLAFIGYEWMPRADKQDAGDDCLGMITSGEWSSLIDTPENKAFVDSYQKAVGRVPDCWDESSYTVVKLILGAIDFAKGDTSSGALVDALYKITVDTPRGKISFDAGGWATCPQYVFKYVKVGDLITLEPLAEHSIYHPPAVTWSYSTWKSKGKGI